MHSIKFKKYFVTALSFLTVLTACEFRPLDRDLADLQYEFAVECLDAFFIFRERLPSDYYAFSSPEELYESVNEPYTEFLNREYARWLVSQLTTTRKGGIGIRIDSVYNGYVIKEVFPNSPGAAAGLQVLDTILRVGDVSTAGLLWDSFTSLLQGEIGSQVVLRIKRLGNQMNITVTRGVFSAPSVFVDSISPAVACIIISGFFQETNTPGGSANEFSIALDKTQWAEYTVIDLRHNGGGYINQCMDIIGNLVPPNTPIIKTHERTYDTITEKIVVIDSTYLSSGFGKASDRKLLLLVDRQTASASEIVVSCLMRRENVTVIGDTTFGKARGQIMLWGPDSVIAKVTCMKITPIGEGATDYDSIGIVPHILADTADAFDLALNYIEEKEAASAKRLASGRGRRPPECDVKLYMNLPCAITTSQKYFPKN